MKSIKPICLIVTVMVSGWGLVSADNAQPLDRLRLAIDQQYAYRDLRGTDWDGLFEIYTPKLLQAESAQRFARVAAGLLTNNKDMHVRVRLNGNTVGAFRRDIKRNYRLSLLEKSIPNWHQHNSCVSTGRFENDIGYIRINHWSRDRKIQLEPAYDALVNFTGCHGLIIDVRANGGGAEPLAQAFAGCFIEKNVLYAKHIYRDAKSPSQWSSVRTRYVRPNRERLPFRSKCVVLMGQANMSSCEAFLLMMKQVPNCQLVGDISYGSSGNPKPIDLGNGVTVWLPSWQALDASGVCFEGKGIKPDVHMPTEDYSFLEEDPVLRRALALLR
jgi:C-terminal processing protease CtpA/Prc